MSRWRRFSAIVQDGKLTVSVVRVRAETIEKAKVAALAKAQKEASTAWPDDKMRMLMTSGKFEVIFLFEGHVRDAF